MHASSRSLTPARDGRWFYPGLAVNPELFKEPLDIHSDGGGQLPGRGLEQLENALELLLAHGDLNVAVMTCVSCPGVTGLAVRPGQVSPARPGITIGRARQGCLPLIGPQAVGAALAP